MLTQKVKICGKTVTVGMCWGTILTFANYTGRNLEEIDLQHPSPADITYLILAAIAAYYQSADKEPPVRDTDLLYKSSPKEIADAAITCCNLLGEFYSQPKGMKSGKADEEEGGEKN